MAFDPNRYTHEADRAALTALKSIPGFSTIVKGFMNMWNEPQQKIMNMSSRIRLGENQMRKYYDMLPPICEKLGIDVPDLYLELDVYPNAYTSGETKPFIVITSGLMETIPDELIPTVLAHECGHIACHHVMYTTMGNILLSGTSTAMSYFLRFGNLLTVPLQVAFYYWMRCSEFSADRAAVLCDGTSEKMQEVCMRFAGWDKDIQAEASMQAFLEQVSDYKDLIDSNGWNKVFEFMLMSHRSHPMEAVRALECSEWAKSDSFYRIINNLPDEKEERKKGAAAINDVLDDVPKIELADEQKEDAIKEKPAAEAKPGFDLFGLFRPKQDAKKDENEKLPDDEQKDITPVNNVEQAKGQPFDLLGFLRPQQNDKATDETPPAYYEELHWYSKLLEEGILTQDEFDKKKREILNLPE